MKAALLSTIPGLGQLYNRRVDKAIAFFLVDVANTVFVSMLLGLPYIELNSALIQHMNGWRAGSAPFTLVQLMILAYVVYSQWDAYRDAEKAASSGVNKSELCLSHTTCASYILHLSAIFALCYVILVKMTPDFRPDLTQISLSFELQKPSETEAKANQGQNSNLPDDLNDTAHIKDRPANEINASSTSAEMLTADAEKSRLLKKAATETDAVASKQIVSPDSKMSPQEVSSKGASQSAIETTNKANAESQVQKVAPADASPAAAKTAEANPEATPESDASSLVKPKLIAQLPPASAAAAAGMTARVDESNSTQNLSRSGVNQYGEHNDSGGHSAAPSASEQNPRVQQTGLTSISASIVAGQTLVQTSHHIEVVSTLRPSVKVPNGDTINDNTSASKTVTNLEYIDSGNGSGAGSGNGTGSGTGTANQTGPSMLGFMDSSLSSDPDAREVWSEMSGNLSRYVREHPLEGQGLAVTTFTLNKNGIPTQVSLSPADSTLAKSLSSALEQMPHVAAPKQGKGAMYFQVRASNDGTSNTFISVELNSQPSTISPESMSDFKYQVNLQAYLKGIKKAVYSSWKPPVQEGIKPVMIGFKVSTSGAITNHDIVQSSGDPKTDRAALNAALSITKWSQPPAGTSEDLDVCMVIQKCKSCEAQAQSERARTQPENKPTNWAHL